MSEYERILKDKKYYYCLINVLTITLDEIIKLEKNEAAKESKICIKFKKEDL